jgi:plastocyanin
MAAHAFPRTRLPLLLLLAVVLTACGGSDDADDDVAAEPTSTSMAATATTATSAAGATPAVVDATPLAEDVYADPLPAGTQTPQAADSDVAEDRVEVEIVDFAFAPQQLEIPVGTTVVFTNSDSAPHTATESGDTPLFDSGSLGTGESFEFTFDAPGTYEYICLIHPSMRGTIVVS